MIVAGIDFETTGLKPKDGAEIIEISLILYDLALKVGITGCTVVVRPSKLFWPILKKDGSMLSPGLTYEYCMNQGVTLDYAFEEISNVFKRIDSDVEYWVAHNLKFEKSFLDHYGYKGTWPPKNIDTMLDAVERKPSDKWISLGEFTDMHKVKNRSPHRAYGDTLAMLNALAECDIPKVIERAEKRMRT